MKNTTALIPSIRDLMSDHLEETPKEKELEILSQAFKQFNEVTKQLEKSYEKLQARVKELDLELALKNEQLEKNLKEKEDVKNYLNNILQSLTTGVIVVEQGDTITTFNKTAGAITGLSPDSCIGKSLNQVLSQKFFQKLADQLARSESQALSMEGEIRRPDGQVVQVRLSVSHVHDNHGRPIGNVFIIQDITQLTRLEEEAKRNDRLRAMGEVAAGIAHEIRNPLASIELFASVLGKDLETDKEKKAIAEHIISGVKNMDRIISSLLLFAKSPEPSRQKCNVNHVLKNILESPVLLGIPENIEVVRQFSPGALQGNGDEELLKQVFLNLIRNAVSAMPDGGQLHVRTEKSAAVSPPQEPGGLHRNFITVSVSDTGVGISPEDRKKVFNPFFTTRDKGTGLGLAITHNIVKAHQGTIDIESIEGQGTTFKVKIPSWETSEP